MTRFSMRLLFVLATLPLVPLSAALPWYGASPAAAQTAGRAADQAAGPRIIQSMRWRAWIDAMPGPGKRYHPIYVQGEILLPTPGYKVTLVKANPRDRRSRHLVLDMKIERVRPPDAQVITRFTPRYLDETPPLRYQSVEVRYQGRVVVNIPQVAIIR